MCVATADQLEELIDVWRVARPLKSFELSGALPLTLFKGGAFGSKFDLPTDAHELLVKRLGGVCKYKAL